MLKFQQKYFIESFPFEDVNPDQLRIKNSRFRNTHNIEKKLHVSKYTQKRNLRVNTPNHFTNTIFRNSCRLRRRFRHEYRKINHT